MDLKSIRIEILKLIRNYAPRNTEFYWHNDTRNSVGFCKAKYCRINKVFYDYEIGISHKFAVSHKREEVLNIAIQEIAHARTLGKGIKEWISEYKRLKSIIGKEDTGNKSKEKEQKDEKAPGMPGAA